MPRLATVACLLVCSLDLVQLAIRPWEMARLGAVAGAILYAMAALLMVRHHPAGSWMACLIPTIPTAILLSNAITGVQPDAWMIGIYAVQLVAAYNASGPIQGRSPG